MVMKNSAKYEKHFSLTAAKTMYPKFIKTHDSIVKLTNGKKWKSFHKPT